MTDATGTRKTDAEAVSRIRASFQRTLGVLEASPLLTDIQRSERLRAVWRLVEEAGIDDDPAAQSVRYETLVWDLADLAPEPGAKRGNRWRPKISFENGAAPRQDPQFLAYVTQRAEQTTSPVHRARYADIAWEFGADYRLALASVRAYLDSLPLLDADEATRRRHVAITRALHLALQLKNGPLVKEAKQALLSELEASRQQSFPYPCFDLLQWLLAIPERWIDADDLKQGRRYAEDAAAYYRSQNGYELLAASSASEAAAAFARRVGDQEGEWAARLAVGTAMEDFAASRSGSSALVEAGLLERALDYYTKIGAKEQADRLRPRVRAAYKAGEPEYGSVGAAVELSFDDADRHADSLIPLTPAQSLALFLSGFTHIPSKALMEAFARDAGRGPILSGLIPRSTIRDGRQIARAQTAEEQERAALFDCYRVWTGLHGTTLARIYRRLADPERWTADTILDFLASGVAFDADKLPLLRAGLERYFARDYISSIHVLVPQIEDILRRLLGKLGQPTTTETRGGATIEVPLETVLKTAEIREGLGEDHCSYFEYLFAEQQGENLRNHVAHGVFQGAEAREPLATLVVDALLTLRAVAIAPAAEPPLRIVPDVTIAAELEEPIAPPAGGLPLPRSAWIRVMTDRIVHDFHPLKVILFGSYARGEAKPDSDVDLLVIFTAVEDKRRQAVDIREALSDLPMSKDVIVADLAEIERRRDRISDVLYSALREGRILYDRE